MPPAYVKPYVKRGKNDVIDAEAILLDRRCPRIALVALANKTARIAWAILARGEVHRATQAIAA